MTRPPSGPRGWAAVVLAPLWWPWQAIGEARWRRTQKPARLPAVEVVRLQAGDRLVVHSPTPLTPEDVARIERHVHAVYGPFPVLVLSGGCRLAVLREERRPRLNNWELPARERTENR